MINALGRSEFLGIEPAHSHIDMMRNFRADDLEQRLVRFAIDIVTLIGQLTIRPVSQSAKRINHYSPINFQFSSATGGVKCVEGRASRGGE